MSQDELSSSELDCVLRTTDALREYIMEVRCSQTDNKDLLDALEYIEKADNVLEEVVSDNILLMYGPPEAVFTPTELAEMRFRDEVIQQIKQTELTAEQWKELVADLASNEDVDFRMILDLLSEKRP